MEKENLEKDLVKEEAVEEPKVESTENVTPSIESDVKALENTQDVSKTDDLDHLFDNLTSDIASVNRFITNLNDQKKFNNVAEKELVEERQRVEKAKLDFDKYMEVQKEEIEKKQKQVEEYLTAQKENLAKAEAEFKDSMDSSLAQLEISKRELEIQEQKLQEDKSQFENYKALEISRIHHAEEILSSERNQFERYKEVTNQKIELDNKTLEQKCARFKEIVGQFNSNFKPILDDKSE